MFELNWPESAPTLADGDVTLRPWRGADAEAVFRACQDEQIQRWTRVPAPYLHEHASDFVGELAAEQWALRMGAPFAVVDGDDELLGSCGLVTIQERDQLGEIGYWIAPWARRRGVARRAAALTARGATVFLMLSSLSLSSRIFFSISFNKSLLAARNTFTLSRPWPSLVSP